MGKKTLTGKNSKILTAWIKKFTSLSNEAIIEFDFGMNALSARTFNLGHSVIKSSGLEFETAELATTESHGIIKVGIRVLNKLAKVLDSFNGEDFKIILEHQDDDDECVRVLVQNKTLKIGVVCASLSTLEYLPEDVFKNNVSVVSDPYNFQLSPATISNIISASSFDSDSQYILFDKRADKFIVSGESFELLIDDNTKTNETQKLYISKKQFNTIDPENYSVDMGEDRLVCTSYDTDTCVVIAKYDVNS